MKKLDQKGKNKISSLIKVSSLLTSFWGFIAIIGWLFNVPYLASFGSGNVPMALSTAVLFVSYELPHSFFIFQLTEFIWTQNIYG